MYWRTAQLIISRTDLVNDDKLVARLDESLFARISGSASVAPMTNPRSASRFISTAWPSCGTA